MTVLNQNTARIDKQWAATAEIDLRQYWQVIDRAKLPILAAALAASLLALIWVFSVAPVYEASATLLVESGAAKVISIEEVYSPDSQGQEYYQTQFELLNSPTVAAGVIDQLKLLDRPEFEGLRDEARGKGALDWLTNGEARDHATTQAIANQLMQGRYLSNLEIAPVDKTQLVEVKFQAHDRTLAADVANTHARLYIANMLETKLGFSQSAAELMGERLQVVKSDLQKSERALQEFREREQVFDSEGLQSLSTRELNDLTSRLLEARRQLETARNASRQVTSLQKSQPKELESLSIVAENNLVQEFRQQQGAARRTVAELGKTYGPRHPKMVAAQSELNTAAENVRRQIDSVVDGVKKNYSVAQAEVKALQASIDDAKQNYHVTGRKESELLRLQREVQTNRQLYDIFYNRMKETNEAGGLQYANARVVAPAIAPLEPVKPNKGLVTGMAFFGTLLFGVLIAFLREALDDTIRQPSHVETLLRVPLLGAIPLLKTNNNEPVALSRTFLGPGDAGFKEAIRTIRSAISLTTTHRPHTVLQVTSAITGEGKSVTALNLAYAFGQMNQVILVECDLRRPSLGKQLKIPSDMPGVSQLLANEASLEDCIVYPDSDKIQFITGGIVPPNPLELLASPAFTKLMLQLRHDYDLVIVDCPPILPVSDATVIATQMDAAVYVTRANSTRISQVKEGLDKLRQTDLPIVGVVVNAVDARDFENYGGHYGDTATTSTL